MSDEKLKAASSEISEILRKAELPPADEILALVIASIVVVNRHMESAQRAGDDEFLRMMRRTLHALPESITQFIQAWQLGRTNQATASAGDLIRQKFDHILRDSKEIDTRRRIFMSRR